MPYGGLPSAPRIGTLTSASTPWSIRKAATLKRPSRARSGETAGSPVASACAVEVSSPVLTVGGFYREVRIPNFCRGLYLGGAFGPDLPPARPRRTTHPLPPHGSPPADRRDRRAARPAPVHHLSGAGP